MTVRELRITYGPTRATEQPTIDGRRPIRDHRDAAALLIPILGDEAQEVFGVLILDGRHRLLGWHEVARGGLTQSQVQPLLVFRPAILLNAPAIVLAHNHPSGDCTPSADDLVLTRRLRDGAALLELEILDHLIITAHRYYSLTETGHW